MSSSATLYSPTYDGGYTHPSGSHVSKSYVTTPATYTPAGVSPMYVSSYGQTQPSTTTTTTTTFNAPTTTTYTSNSGYVQPSTTYSTTSGMVGGPAFQYTTESSQRYVPPGTQPVSCFPHGIASVYNVGQVPAFLAAPEISISATDLTRWSAGVQEIPTVYRS